MSAFSEFMSAALEKLGELDDERRAPNPNQPPVFVRTNWLFVEIDEALRKASDLSARIKTERVQTNVPETARLNIELCAVTYQLALLTVWVDQQFRKEVPDANN